MPKIVVNTPAPQGGTDPAPGRPPTPPPSFERTLVLRTLGLVVVMGLILLASMAWQGKVSTEAAARQEIEETLNRSAERLRILTRAATMTLESAERAAGTFGVRSDTLRPILEHALAAFEQRPELSYIGLALAETGEYGNLERTASGQILLWLFPGTRRHDAMVRNFALTPRGFELRQSYPADGYDPRSRPFYQAAVKAATAGTWMPVYRWIVHRDPTQALWGASHVKALHDGTGQVAGVLDTDLDLPALNGFLRGLARDYQVELHVVELGGAAPRLIAGPQVSREPLAVPDDLLPMLDVPGGAGVTDRRVLAGERRWVAAQRMTLAPDLSWVVIASRKDPFIEAPLRRQLLQVIAMGAAIVVALLLLSMRTARRFGEPLAALERRVTAIGRNELAGGLDDAPQAAAAFRETRLLSDALQHMTQMLRQQARAKEQQVATLALKGALFDFTDSAIFTIDERGVVQEWNAAAQARFGLAREQIVGRLLEDGVQGPQGPVDWAALAAAQGVGTCHLVGAHGPFVAELRCVTFEQDGRRLQTLILNDISERERHQQRLQAFNAELEQRVALRTRELQAVNTELDSFCHSVSHDLRSPLRGIAGFAEVLVKNYSDVLDDKGRNYLGRVVAATRRMGELIDDLLALSRVSRHEMHRRHVDLSAMARQVLAELRQAAPERQVQVSVEDGLVVEGDPGLLRIVLENLLGNAWKFTSKTPDARITLAAAVQADGSTALAVSDNGAGFDMRYADKLFGAFQRLHRATEFPGTGVGLATVQRILHRHGGRIWARGEPGQGAVFTFSLERIPP